VTVWHERQEYVLKSASFSGQSGENLIKYYPEYTNIFLQKGKIIADA